MNEIISSPQELTTTGARLREARLTLYLTQSEFSAKCGVKLGTLKNYEVNASEPSTESLRAFMTAGISPVWLIAGQLPIFTTPQPPIKLTKQEALILASQILDDASKVSQQILDRGLKAASLMEDSTEMDKVNQMYVSLLADLDDLKARAKSHMEAAQ